MEGGPHRSQIQITTTSATSFSSDSTSDSVACNQVCTGRLESEGKPEESTNHIAHSHPFTRDGEW